MGTPSDQAGLGRLERVAVRDAWPGEAADFTPWLALPSNLALLGEAIGLDLEEETATEQPVGDFRADIVARDGETVVLVENQFGRTDHDHLGKLLVYGSGVGAEVVVWISERLRPEHRRALDWLNENTREGLAFFGLELELWRIGDSPAAPKFNVVSRPNDWARAIRAAVAETPLKAQQLEFWQGFAEHVESQGLPLKLAPARARYYQRIRLGRSGYQIALFRYAQRAEVVCELRISHHAATEAFDTLEAQRIDIEAVTGPLDWLRQPDKRVSRIQVRNSVDPGDPTQWPAAFDWLAETATLFQTAFAQRLAALPTGAESAVGEDTGESDVDESD